MLIEYLFYCSHTNLYLHSFPTRRSSDLQVAAKKIRAAKRFRAKCAFCKKNSSSIIGQYLYCLNLLFKSQFHNKEDRKSTRLNSSHRCISYAVFCLKKKNRTLYVISIS